MASFFIEKCFFNREAPLVFRRNDFSDRAAAASSGEMIFPIARQPWLWEKSFFRKDVDLHFRLNHTVNISPELKAGNL